MRDAGPAELLLERDRELESLRSVLQDAAGGGGRLALVEGPAGIASATETRPDLILMDISLPGMDGWEATKVLRSQAETAAIPIIALTAHAMESDRQRSIEVGCNDFDTKPVDLARLLVKIDALLAPAS